MSRGSTYSIASSILTVHCQEADFFPLIHHYLQQFECDGDKTPTTHAILYSHRQSVSIPAQSILYRIVDGIYYYRKDCSYAVTIPDVCMFLLDYEQGTLDAWIAHDEVHLIEMLLYMIKWLLIKTAELHGSLYLHGPLSSYNRQFFSIIGNSGSGKTTTHHHLLSLGATHYSDDVTLLFKDKAFAFLSNDKHSVISQSKEHIAGGTYAHNELITLLLPSVWNDTESLLEETSFSEIRNDLWNIYEKETSWNAYSMPKDDYLERAAEYLQEARIYRLYSGSSTSSVLSACSRVLAL